MPTAAPALILSPEPPWKAGVRGARANLLPGLALWAVAAATVASYYFWPAAHAAFEQLAVFRERSGFFYAIVATGLCGGFIPFLYLRAQKNPGVPYVWRDAAFLTLVWAYKGIEVDLVYRGLAHLLGTGHNPGTLLGKMFLDQFVYCPIWAVPSTLLVYVLREARYDWALVGRRLDRRFYPREVLPALLANMGVWVPAVLLIYSLPSPLQLPLFNVVLCFWTLILAHVAARSATQSPAPSMAS
jgi:hypothetical protein